MGQERRGLRALLVAEQEEVEVERAGRFLREALAAELELDALRELEQLLGAEVGPADRDGVEERRLGGRGDRFGQVERRDDERAQRFFEPVERLRQNAPGVAEIAAQGEREPPRNRRGRGRGATPRRRRDLPLPR